MEDSFRVRVDRIFGSLASSSSSSLSPCANLSSLWSLTDDEVEKREWNREKDIPETEVTSYSSNLDGLFAKKRSSVGFGKQLEQDLEDLDDDDLEGETRVRGSSSRPVKPDDYNHEEWEIRSSIGLDCALDNEVIIFVVAVIFSAACLLLFIFFGLIFYAISVVWMRRIRSIRNSNQVEFENCVILNCWWILRSL